MHETAFSQPANFALQVALTELWKSWGIEPSAIVGHSAGEVAAGYVAGAYSLADGCRIIYHRSRLQALTAGLGSLIALGISEDEARYAIGRYGGELAAINSPQAITITGNEESLKTVIDHFVKRGAFARELKVDIPFHSHHMEEIKDRLLRPSRVSVSGLLRFRSSLLPVKFPTKTVGWTIRTGGETCAKPFNSPLRSTGCWRMDTINSWRSALIPCCRPR